jgi:hypothetical protein
MFFGLSPQLLAIRAAVFVFWSVLCFGSGYGYKAHRYQVADAAKVATQETAQVTANAGAKASDSVAIANLQSQLNASNNWAASLQNRIKDAQNANAPAVSCRLPDSLLQSINADLTPRTP